MPGEADIKVFAPPFSKGGQGYGDSVPMLLQEHFFESLKTFLR
jgi:hypothetical protein